jgi:hypothetical protein
MLRRTGLAALWFVSILWLHELAWSVAGSPRPIGFLLAGFAAAVIWFDPLARFHPSPRLAANDRADDRLIPETGLVRR